MTSRVSIRTEGNVAWFTLTRPDKHNGIDLPMLRAVVDAQKKLARLRDVRAVVLYGEGPSFCAGLDFKSVMGKPLQMVTTYPQLLSPVRNTFQRWSMGLRRIGLPVIAAIHGNCFGGGLQLALGADIRVAAPDARLSVMEAKWGLIPDMGGAALLRELVPLDLAKELTFTGRIVSGEQAHALGLVTHVADDPLAYARDLAAEIASRSPDAVAAAKFLLQEAYHLPEEAALRRERRYQRKLLGTPNQRIAVQRNQQKQEIPFASRRVGH